MAPEILEKIEFYPKKADVWSLGVLTFRLLMGRLPFYSSDCNGLLSKIQSFSFETIENFNTISTQAQSFLKKALEKNPSKRASIKELQQHEWISQHN